MNHVWNRVAQIINEHNQGAHTPVLHTLRSKLTGLPSQRSPLKLGKDLEDGGVPPAHPKLHGELQLPA